MVTNRHETYETKQIIGFHVFDNWCLTKYLKIRYILNKSFNVEVRFSVKVKFVLYERTKCVTFKRVSNAYTSAHIYK